MTFDDLLPPVTDLASDFDKAISPWHWLVRDSASPLLITALGDVFMEIVTSVYFLDTLSGSISRVAESRAKWKEELQNPERINEWFLPEFVEALKEGGQRLKSGEVFSPTIPLVLGGSMSVENFTPSQWRMHLHVLGQIHKQVRRLAPGTRIDNIKIEPLP